MEKASDQQPVVNQCPDCSQSVDVTALPPFSKISCPHCSATFRVKTFLGQYQLTGILGEGGMSKVFRAVDSHLGREVALKVLHPALSRDAALTAMFEREAKLTASILHPNVVKVYTVGREQGYFFIAMELVRATSLEEMIANKGSLSESDVLAIAHDVTNGLAAAQEEGLIHRDIKPGNMLVTEDDTAKLVDFGLAVQQGGEDESEDLWATPFYVPPEKLEGDTDTYLGDIYSLGATLFHALAGCPPFDANTSSLEELKVIKKRDLDLKGQVPSLSKSTLRLVEKMMSYDAVNRPQSYQDILDHIATIQKRQFGITPSSREVKPANKKAIIALGVCSALLAVALALNYFQSKKREQEQAGVGISNDDRVISAGDNSNTARFLEGRRLISVGNFRKAKPIFDSLVVETSLSPSIRKWSLFFQGTTRLFSGEEKKARESFGLIDAIDAIDPEGETGINDLRGLMQKSSRSLAEPLPVLQPDKLFDPDSVEIIGFLVAGIKNWQMGQFEAGLEAMKVFEEGSIPENYDWMGSLQQEVSKFRRDYAVFATLPNPSRSSNEPLVTQRSELEKAREELSTQGAMQATIKKRIDRIDTILQMEKDEVADRLRMEQAREKAEKDNPSGTTVMPPENVPPELSPEELAEKVEFQTLLTDLNEYRDTYLFSAAVSRLKAYEPQTKAGERWEEGLTEGYTHADQFIPLLARLLSENEFEGIIVRKEGVPLEAQITAATSSTFTLDLGFGPNDVGVEKFDANWMTETAEGLLSPLAPDSVEAKKKIIFFSIANGVFDRADRLAAELSAADTEFALLWESLTELRSNTP